jgi:hypothetical protein
MTVTTSTNKKTYTGDASTTAFAYNFKILASTDLKIYTRLIASPYTETLQTETTHYSVSGVGDAGGGTVTMVSAPASTLQLIIVRAVPQTQLTDYTANDAFPAETHEEALDRLAMIVQDQQEVLDRTLKTSKTVTDLTTPEFVDPAAARASKFLGFSSDGTELQVSDGPLTDTEITSAADAHILLYDDGDSRWENKAVSGDIAITAAGVVSIASGVIVNADVSGSAAIVDTKLATISTADKVSGAAVQVDGAADGTGITIVDADKLLVDDGGTTKYVNASQLNSYISAAVAADDIGTGDAAASFQTSSGAVVVDSQASTTTIDGHTGVTVQSSSSGDILLDSAADVVLDAAGNDIGLKASGTQFGALSNSSSDFIIAASVEDKDILLKGDDGGSAITALQLDMSDAGKATFNGAVAVGTSIELGHATDTTIARASSGDITIEGNAVYRAGGTDVAVADGGTGAGTLTDGGVLLGSGTGAITAMAVLGDGELIVGDGSGDPVAESGATLRTSIGLGTGDSPQFTTVTASTSVIPDAAGGADLGSTSAEWGDVYVADDKAIKLGNDQDLTIEYDEDGLDTTRVVAAGGLTMSPHGTSSGNTTELRFLELAANGNNYAGLKAPDSITGTSVYTLPAAFPASNKVLQSTDAGVLTWESGAAGVSLANDADNRVVTAVGDGTINGESALTFDGSLLTAPAINLGDENLSTYNEGTFTPTIAFGGNAVSVAYGQQDGEYTVIGDIVHVQIQLILTNKGSSTGSATLRGLPFTRNNSIHSTAGLLYMNRVVMNTGGGYYHPIGLIGNNSTQINLNEAGDDVAPAALTDADFLNSTYIFVQTTYRVA